ncbi:MAG: helix-turn-helix transcriptional regulator [Bacteroides cellulosilyticus]
MNRRFGSVLIDKEQQLCCLLCAEFSTKEISVVTQQSIPTIYQRKTNIRKKLGMGEKEDIVGFISGEIRPAFSSTNSYPERNEPMQ